MSVPRALSASCKTSCDKLGSPRTCLGQTGHLGQLRSQGLALRPQLSVGRASKKIISNSPHVPIRVPVHPWPHSVAALRAGRQSTSSSQSGCRGLSQPHHVTPPATGMGRGSSIQCTARVFVHRHRSPHPLASDQGCSCCKATCVHQHSPGVILKQVKGNRQN